MTEIHPTAVVSDRAVIGDNVQIGAYSIIGDNVSLGDGCKLYSHVVVDGTTSIGPNCQIYPFSSIGLQPQDLKYRGEESRLEIGSNNVIREHVTINPGTEGGGLVTKIGNNCNFLTGTHVAHDCQIGDNVIMVNGSTLAGHCHVGDFAILGGLCAVHQFVRIGRNAFIGGMSGVENDVIPFGSVLGNRANLGGLNLVGMKRSNMARESIHAVRRAYKLMFEGEGTLQERVSVVEQEFANEEAVQEIVAFIKSKTDRGFCMPRNGK